MDSGELLRLDYDQTNELIRTLLGAGTAGIHLMVYGAILVAIMILAPRGIVGLFEKRFSPKKEK